MRASDENCSQSTRQPELWRSGPAMILEQADGIPWLCMGLAESLGLFEMEIVLPARTHEQNRSILGYQPKRAVGQQRLSILQSVFQI